MAKFNHEHTNTMVKTRKKTEQKQWVKIKNRYTTVCGVCQNPLPEGEYVMWLVTGKQVAHLYNDFRCKN